MTKQLKCYYLLLIRHDKLSLLNQFLAGYSIMAAWGNNLKKQTNILKVTRPPVGSTRQLRPGEC